tara:strand:+ start:1409 stop:2056 length:648 start_codon:yes stop_codon:yes gene_type:complete
MASSSSQKIKSAISAKGSAERQLTSDYADVTSSLLDSELSSKEFDLDIKESDEFFNTLYSGLEVADTLSQGWEEKAKLKSDIDTFEGSLPEGISPMRIEKKTSLMDVFQKKGKIGDYLYGQDEYFVGDKSYGSMYDVAARGKQIKSLDSVKDLLSGMPGEAFSSDRTTLRDFNLELNFDMSKYNTFPNKTIDPDPIYQDLRGTEDEMGKLGGGFG